MERSDDRPGSAAAQGLQRKVSEILKKHEKETSDSQRFMETLKASAISKREAVYAALLSKDNS